MSQEKQISQLISALISDNHVLAGEQLDIIIAGKLSERIKNINESLDNNTDRTAFFNTFKEINDGSLAAMDVENSNGPKVYKGINLDRLWNSLVMNSGSKSFDGDVDVEKTYNAYSKLEEGFFDRVAAKASGAKAGIKASVKNFGTKVKGGGKAAGQMLTGKFGKAAGTLQNTQKTTNKNDPKKAAKVAKLASITKSVSKDLNALFPGDPAVAKALAALVNIGKVATSTPPPLPRKKAAKRVNLPKKP